MLFVLAEWSRQDATSKLFKNLYDGSAKAYPNGANMLFIPLNEGALNSTPYREKIIIQSWQIHCLQSSVQHQWP
jgi:hypothetical protein